MIKDFILVLSMLPPDIPIWISDKDVLIGRDAILEKAIEILTAK
jgi:hypothetical protein